MKTLKQQIIEKLSEIGYLSDKYAEDSIRNAILKEPNLLAYDVLSYLIENIDIAKEKNFPLCQDTGNVVFWVKMPPGVNINFETLLNEAVVEAFNINNYRKSIVKDPVNRKNTNNNTPSIIHYEIKDTDSIEISMMLKGGGSENMSALKMLTPGDGIQGIRKFVIDTIINNAVNACPPLTVGIGIGGNFETCALLAKKSLFRLHGEKNPDDYWAKEEEFLLNEINQLRIGSMGFGGNLTAINVNIEVKPCHIASLPVAVNLECHAHRVAKVVY